MVTTAMAMFVAIIAIVPPSALAHGIGGRLDLPIPEWLFGWAAAIVLAVSFAGLAVLWSKPRFEDPNWRPLPFGVGRVLAGRVVCVVCGLIGVALLALTIYSASAGTASSPANNFAPVFVYVVFWIGLVPVSILFGDVFSAFNPWRAIGRCIDGAMATATGSGASEYKPPFDYPEKLGRWPAALGLFAFTWTELVADVGSAPKDLALAAGIYTAFNIAGCLAFGSRVWIGRAEAFSVYFNLLSRISPIQRRGNEIGVQAPLSALAGWRPLSGGVSLLAVMIGTVTYDGLSNGELWRTIANSISEGSIGISGDTDNAALAGAGMTVCVLAILAFFMLGVLGVRSATRSKRNQDEMAKTFIHSLVPIAAVYVMAHYLSFLLFQGPDITRLISDPLGRGDDLFGTASFYFEGIVIRANYFWYIQIAMVVAGHVAGIITAHDRALAAFRNAKDAVRSQYYMLAVMVGFTSLALWLLSASNR